MRCINLFFFFIFNHIHTVKILPNLFTLFSYFLTYFIFHLVSHRGNIILKVDQDRRLLPHSQANKEHLELNRISRFSNLLRYKVQLGHLAGGCATPIGCYLRELAGYKGTGADQFDMSFDWKSNFLGKIILFPDIH